MPKLKILTAKSYQELEENANIFIEQWVGEIVSANLDRGNNIPPALLICYKPKSE